MTEQLTVGQRMLLRELSRGGVVVKHANGKIHILDRDGRYVRSVRFDTLSALLSASYVEERDMLAGRFEYRATEDGRKRAAWL